MKPLDLRVREEELALAAALCIQRGLERASLLRDAMALGLLLLAASGPPAADGPSDVYGTLTGLRLAQLLRPRLVAALDFVQRYDPAPLVFGSLHTTAPARSPALPRHGLSAVDTAMDGTLESFGIGALGEG